MGSGAARHGKNAKSRAKTRPQTTPARSAPISAPAFVLSKTDLARFRVPAGTPEAVADLADRALLRAVDVMEERVDPRAAKGVLQAAFGIREDVCGPVPRDINLKGTLSFEQLVRKAAALPAAEPRVLPASQATVALEAPLADGDDE